MGSEPTTLHDLVGCSTYHWATGDSVVSKSPIVGIDWNCITRLHSHMLVHVSSLTASCYHIKVSHIISIGNHMILSAIWNEISTGKIFQRRPKLHEPRGWVQFVVFEKIYKCLFIPNCTRKVMWLLINNIHEKIWNI